MSIPQLVDRSVSILHGLSAVGRPLKIYAQGYCTNMANNTVILILPADVLCHPFVLSPRLVHYYRPRVHSSPLFIGSC